MRVRNVLKGSARYLSIFFLFCAVTYIPNQAWAGKVDANNPNGIAVKYIQAINARRFDDLRSVLSPNLLQHFSDAGTEVHGSDALISRVQGAVQNLPDLHLSLARVVANGDMLATMVDVSFSRNGKPVKQFWIDLWRIQGGRIVEHWES